MVLSHNSTCNGWSTHPDTALCECKGRLRVQVKYGAEESKRGTVRSSLVPTLSYYFTYPQATDRFSFMT